MYFSLLFHCCACMLQIQIVVPDRRDLCKMGEIERESSIFSFFHHVSLFWPDARKSNTPSSFISRICLVKTKVYASQPSEGTRISKQTKV